MDLVIKAKNYEPGTMSFSAGFSGPRGNVGSTMKVDEVKARKILEELQRQGKDVVSAVLGLDGDFTENSTVIYHTGDFYSYDAYDHSIWAEPILLVRYEDGSNEAYACWKKD